MNYRKKPSSGRVYKLLYRHYPNFVKVASKRYQHYNDTVEHIIELEKSGQVFVIRPSQSIDIGRLEKDPDKFEEVYQHGVADAEQSMADLSVYLTTNPKD